MKKGATINGSAAFSGFPITATLAVNIKKTARHATLTVVYTLSQNGVTAYQTIYVGTQKLKRK